MAGMLFPVTMLHYIRHHRNLHWHLHLANFNYEITCASGDTALLTERRLAVQM
jgi:hypothetical protein